MMKAQAEQFKPFIQERYIPYIVALLAYKQVTPEQIIEHSLVKVTDKKEFKVTKFELTKPECFDDEGVRSVDSVISHETIKRKMIEEFDDVQGDFQLEDSLQVGILMNKLSQRVIGSLNSGEMGQEEMSQGGPPRITIISEFLKEALEALECEGQTKAIIDIVTKNQPLAAIYPLFLGNQSNRLKVDNTIRHARTYKELHKYGGLDFEMITKRFEEALKRNLKFTPEINHQVYKEIMENPMSLIVADHEDIAPKHKKAFYESEIFTNGILREYTNMFEYKDSIQFKAGEQMDQIYEFLEKTAGLRINLQVSELIMTYDIEQIFKIDLLRSNKKRFLQLISEKLPNYNKAYIQTRIMGKEIETLRFSDATDYKFKIRECFLENNLPFQHWNRVEAAFFKQDYSELQNNTNLNFADRHQIRLFVIETLRPYFYTEQNPYSYSQKIGKVILDGMMRLPSERKLDGGDMLAIRDELLQCKQSFDMSIYEDALKKDKNEFKKILQGCKQCQQFLAHQGQDRQRLKFDQETALLTQIENVNQEDHVSVPYDNVSKFVSQYLEKMEVPAQFEGYVCDRSKLSEKYQAKQPKKVEQKGAKGNTTSAPPGKKQEAGEGDVSQESKAFFNERPQLELTKLKCDKFEGKEVQLIAKLVQQNDVLATTDAIKQSLGTNVVKAKKILPEIQKPENKQVILSLYSRLGKGEKGAQPPSPSTVQSEKVEEPAQPAKAGQKDLTQFYDNYFQAFPGCQLKDVLGKKPEMKTEEFVKKILSNVNNLSSKDDPAYTGLNIVMKKKLAQEFSKEANKAFIMQQAQALLG